MPMAWTHSLQLFSLLFLSTAWCAPTSFDNDGTEHVSLSPLLSGVAAAAVLVLLVLVVFSCICCQNQGFKSFTEHNGIQLPQRGGGGGNFDGLHADSEFTIFPPATMKFPSSTVNGELEHVTFEPLPDITPRSRAPYERPLTSGNLPRPAYFKASVARGLSLHDWFNPPYGGNFPRSRLQYLQELGVGWYGQAVEGEAQQITADQRKTKVVVKILREDASPSEHMYFLHEVRLFRDLRHPNILQLLGQCLEMDPFLVLLEHCHMNLKTYLISQRSSSDELLQGGLLLEMICQVTSGLQHMHSKSFIHTDLSARNCLLNHQWNVKIGDYGASYNLFPEDYYCFGEVAFPLRWSAPESLLCTEKSIETKEITQEGNIWSFGVMLWEMMELGKQPYMELNDEKVLRQVVERQEIKLEEPKTACLHRALLFQIMQLCWGPPESRPSISKIQVLLSHLQQNKEMPPSQAFEERWHTLQQQSFAPRQHNLQFMIASPESPPLVFESHFNPKSASLQNLRGSLEDIVLKQEQEEEEEDKVQHQITLAIQELDDYLASEITSSEISSDTATPEQKELVEWRHLKATTEEGSDGDSAILCSSLTPAEHSSDGGRETEDSSTPDVSGRSPNVKAKDLEYVSSQDVSSPPSPPPSPSMRCGNFGCFSSGSTNSDVRHTVAFGPAHAMTLLDTPPVTPDAFSSCLSACNSRYPLSPRSEVDLHSADCHSEQPGVSTDAPSRGVNVQTSKENSVQNSGEMCEFVNDAQSCETETGHILLDYKSLETDSVKQSDADSETLPSVDRNVDLEDDPCQFGSIEMEQVDDKNLKTDPIKQLDVTADVDFETIPSSDRNVDVEVDICQFETKQVDVSFHFQNEERLKLEPAGRLVLTESDDIHLTDHNNQHPVFKEGISSLSSSPVSLPANDPTSIIPVDEEMPFHSILNLCHSNQPVNTFKQNDPVSNVFNDENFDCSIEQREQNTCTSLDGVTEQDNVIQNFNAEEGIDNGLVTSNSNCLSSPSININKSNNDQISSSDFASLEEFVAEMANHVIDSSVKTACVLLSVKNSVQLLKSDYFDNVCTEMFQYSQLIQDDFAEKIPDVPSDTFSQYCTHDGSLVVDDDANDVNDCYSVSKQNGYCYVNNMLVSFPPYDDCQGVDFKGNSNTVTVVPHFNGDVDIFDQLTDKVMNCELPCDKHVQLGELSAKELFAESKYCPESQYEIEDILTGLENGEIDLDKDYSPASDGSGRKSAEDCTLFLEDLETGSREPIHCCPDNEDLLEDELLIVNVETNEAMMLDPILRTFHEEPPYDDFHRVDCYHSSRLESIMEESDDASHTYNDVSKASGHYFHGSPGNIVHSVPPELVFEGDEILAGEQDDTDDDEDNSFQSDELDEEECEDEEEEDQDDGEEANEEFHFKLASPYSDTRPDDAYTPDFESDTDDTSSSTGTSRTSSSGSFDCPKVQSPVKIFSTAWDCSITPTRSAIKSPEKNKDQQKADGTTCVIGEMKKSVSFHEEDPKVVFSYPPIESDEDSEGDVAAEEFTFQVDYNSYADWDFQWTEEEIPEEDLEEATEEDISEARPFCSTPQGHLGPINMMYSLCCEEMLDSLDSQASLSSNTESLSFKPSPSLSVKIEPITDSSIFSDYQTCLENQTDMIEPYMSAVQFSEDVKSPFDPFQTVPESGIDSQQVEHDGNFRFPLHLKQKWIEENIDTGKCLDWTDSSLQKVDSCEESHEDVPSGCSVTLTDQYPVVAHSNTTDMGLLSNTPSLPYQPQNKLENEKTDDLKSEHNDGEIHGENEVETILDDGKLIDTKTVLDDGKLSDIQTILDDGKLIDVESISDDGKIIDIETLLDDGKFVDVETHLPSASNHSISSLLSDPISGTPDSESLCEEDILHSGEVENETSLYNLKNDSLQSLSLSATTEAKFQDNWNAVQDAASFDKSYNLNILACQGKGFTLDSLTAEEFPEEEDLKRQDVNQNSQINGVWNSNFDVKPQANLGKESIAEGVLKEENDNGFKRDPVSEDIPDSSVSVSSVSQNRYSDDILEAVNLTLVYDAT